ncbi:hypothetical protein BH09BAC1_BH09BAC1_07920 [soil metagenome]
MLPTSPKPPHAFFNSRAVIAIWVVLFAGFLIFTDVWSLPAYRSVLSWDVFGYYAYLPATFLHHDLLHLEELRNLYEAYSPSSYFYAAHLMDNGNYSMSYTMGLALLYIPFFFLGHLVATLSGAPADGFSWPYQLAIYFGSGVYSLVGIVVIRKVLLRYFQDHIVASCLLILILATNYFFYSFIENPMSHSYLFTLYALMLWFTIRWHETFKLKFAVLMGFVIGFIILVRPTDIVGLLIPVLWGVTNKITAIAKAKALWHHKGQLLVLSVCTFLVGLPQLLYWKYTTGHFLYYSYGGLGFDFAHPHLMDGVFSWRKGWLIYTPAMVLAIIGFIPLYFTKRFMFWGMLLFALVNIYIVFSWSVWYYGGGFGARAMVQSYAVMLFPLAALLSYLQGRKLLRWGVWILLGAFTVLNLFQIWQYRMGMYSTEGMTPYVYRLLFFNTHVEKKEIMNLEHREHLPENNALREHIGYAYAEGDTLVLKGQGPEHIVMDTVLTPSPNLWVQVRLNASFNEMEYSYGNLGKAQIKFLDAQGKVLKKAQVKIQNLLASDSLVGAGYYFGNPHSWENIVFESKAPEGTQRIIVLLKNPGYAASTIWVSNVSVAIWAKE